MKTDSKTAIILGMAIVSGVVGISVGFSSLESTSFEPSQTIIQNEDTLQVSNIDKSRYKLAPDLVGIANYINTTPEQLAKEIEGKLFCMIFGLIAA